MSSSHTQSLTEEEIDQFIKTLDHNKDGKISFAELEQQLDHAFEELKPHVARKTEKDVEADIDEEKAVQRRHAFIRKMLGEEHGECIPVQQFKDRIQNWKIPSLEQEKQNEKEEGDHLKRASFRRKMYAWWRVVGPEYVFMAVVVALQLGLGIWQCLKYALGREYQAAFGWGVALAKFSAGALYPTLFFLLLSMSRWWSTAMRRFYYVSRFINWDHAQAFHILMSVETLLFATLHAIGHLSGSFNFGSMPDRQAAVGQLLGQDAIPKRYIDYVRTLPGSSGLTALGTLYCISLLSMPIVRKWSYELFQSAHLLMFPFIGLLMAHGARRLLQYPVLGFILAIPTLLILLERGTRLIRSFISIPATITILDKETVCVSCQIPDSRIWPYEAGQFVFLQVPQLSRFQWHPFTISLCLDREMQLHIKTDGDWTGKLRDLAGEEPIKIGLDGPFGAPAQRFYDFDQAIIVGAGIGITPFSAILHDLQEREDHRWKKNDKQDKQQLSRHPSILPDHNHIDLELYRRVDMHWIVRDKNALLWFSDLLNDISNDEKGHDRDHLDIRIFNHVTRKHDDISLHIFRWLLEQNRTEENQQSPLTGLIAPTHFGRPNFKEIMQKHYTQMQELFASQPKRKRKIGVFFCGSPIIGAQLADLCDECTLLGVRDGSLIEYHFQIEVFG
ncbi:uncharacterized protein FA14DRAFT_139337 [Meira miltonrushii]|uniref:FAD-binding FR-type domain-containing protein n=1 Tax=Meira miltonrushii TaxID=1280837 RepID=A0A316V5W6_9BASI|nr:uncharacterized protein FA14DRAFT_139337 [Meira miltonrushii]PWN31593.1 hypothetical protein FA14DRAFT_139337 [Meira miltonrushii]